MMETFDDVLLVVDQDGLKIDMVTPNKVALMEFFMPNDLFEEFEVSDRFECGVKLKHLYDIFKNVKSKESVVIEDSDDKLRVEIRGVVKRILKLPKIDVEYMEHPALALDFSASISMIGKVFATAIEESTKFSPELRFITKDNTFILRAKNPSKGEYVFELSTEDPALEDIDVKDGTKATYSGEFLKKLVKYVEPTSTLKFEYGTDIPCKITYTIGGAKFVWYLAPIISDEE